MYSTGDCLVCGGTGAQLVFVDTQSNLFLFCPMCGTGWRSIQAAHTLSTIETIEQVAPDGFAVATREEIFTGGWFDAVVQKHASDDWMLPRRVDAFTFTDSQAPDGFLAIIPSDLSSKAELLRVLAVELRFPDYFGHNWDALNECINDLSWLPADQCVIQHSDLPQLSARDTRIYLGILRDATFDEEYCRRLIIRFPFDQRFAISRLLAADD